MTRDVTAIVLAGGRAERFGADKLAASLDGRSVLDRAIGALGEVAPDIVVVGSTRALPVIDGVSIRAADDPEPFGGPLQALAGGLASTSSSVAVVVAGDMPSLVPSVLALLIQTLDAAGVDAAILLDPRDPSRRQPMPLAIRVQTARAMAAAALEAGDRSLMRLLERLRLEELPAERWLPLDPDARTLLDIDLPADLRRARDVARDQRMR